MGKQKLFMVSVLMILCILGVVFVSAEKGVGGAEISVYEIDLDSEGSHYDIRPGRLKFVFDNYSAFIQNILNSMSLFILC